MSVYILVVDDEPDVEALFRQQFRRDIRAGRFSMEFAPSAPAALVASQLLPIGSFPVARARFSREEVPPDDPDG